MENGTKTRDGRTWQAYAENLQRSRSKVRKALGARDGEQTAKAAERVATSGRRLGQLVMDLCDVLNIPVTTRCEELVGRVRHLQSLGRAPSARHLSEAARDQLKMHLLLDACAVELNRPSSDYDGQAFVTKIVGILTNHNEQF